jgi:hypothetical protein
MLLQNTNHPPPQKSAPKQGVNQKISVQNENSNGFKDQKKHKFVSDLTRENNLNFIAASKTSQSDFTPRFLKNLCIGKDYL